jgi:hypothetical protein
MALPGQLARRGQPREPGTNDDDVDNAVDNARRLRHGL